jgi:protein ImuB
MAVARPASAVERHVVLRCAHWSVIASGAALDTPVAVVADHRVVAASRPARAEGVRIGLRRRDAQARCPSITLIDHDPDRDARRFEPVVRSLTELVPVVEVPEPGVVMFGSRGPSRWCGGDAALAERVVGLVRAALDPDLELGLGLADGRFAATIAAHHAGRVGRPVVVAPGPEATAEFLGPVGVRSLSVVGGLPGEFIGLLERLGIRTLGAFRALPVRDVAARFGPDGSLAHRWATGHDDRHLAAAAPPPDLAVTQVFEEPATQMGTVVFAARQSAEELATRLDERGEVCLRLLVEAETEHGERSDRRWSQGSGLSAAAMVERVRWQLDGWVGQPGGLSGGVVLVRLVPEEIRAARGRQLGFWGEATSADEVAVRAITRVIGLLGPEAVLVPEWNGGRHPGERYRWVPASSTDVADPSARRRALTVPDHPWPGSLGVPSPAWVTPQPVPAVVLDVHGEPVRVDGRGAVSAEPARFGMANGDGGTGRLAEVVAWGGPWPTDERWWDPARRRRRARFQLVTADREAVLVALESGRWWLEARYA